jgi:hypothetical protein
MPRGLWHMTNGMVDNRCRTSFDARRDAQVFAATGRCPHLSGHARSLSADNLWPFMHDMNFQ